MRLFLGGIHDLVSEKVTEGADMTTREPVPAYDSLSIKLLLTPTPSPPAFQQVSHYTLLVSAVTILRPYDVPPVIGISRPPV